MRVRFINLDAARARRAALEASFAEMSAPEWSLTWVQATEAATTAAIPGAATPAEKACFLSHRRALEAALADAGPSLIVEDDVLFSPRLPSVFAHASRAMGEWDVLFAECFIADPAEMLRLARECSKLRAAGSFIGLDLAGKPVAGSAAYFVSERGKRKLLDLLGAGRIDRSYDLALRDLAGEGKIDARAIFPSIVTLGPEADDSQIRGDRFGELAISTYRRALFIEPDEAQIARAIALLQAATDENGRLFGAIFGAMASADFPTTI